MKKKIYFNLIMILLVFVACQNELYKDPTEDFQSPEGVYITNSGVSQTFVEENKEINVKDLLLSITHKSNSDTKVTIADGDKNQLDAYNNANNKEFILLPKEMYQISNDIVFEPGSVSKIIPLILKNVKFPTEGGDYALPIKIKNSSNAIIEGEDEVILILEKRIKTKSLRMNTYGSEGVFFPDDFKVDQWTLEVMVNRAAYNANNRAIVGTKLVQNAGPHDEVYTRFGDVTIDPNQLQIKTASSQIDVEKSKFAAEPNTWYMLAFVYDGKKNTIYVNGNLVAEREMRTGAYGVTGLFISGSNELVREVRYWKTARTAQQIKDFAWKMVNPNDENLLMYYPLNGLKRDFDTKEITEDETKLWDWSQTEGHLDKHSTAIFDDNGGKYFIFPEE